MKTQKTLEQILAIEDQKVRSKELVALADSYIKGYIDSGLMFVEDLDMYIDSVVYFFEKRFGGQPFINVSNEMKDFEWLYDNFFKIFKEDNKKELMHNQNSFRELVICVENGLDIDSQEISNKLYAISDSKELILGINPFKEEEYQEDEEEQSYRQYTPDGCSIYSHYYFE